MVINRMTAIYSGKSSESRLSAKFPEWKVIP